MTSPSASQRSRAACAIGLAMLVALVGCGRTPVAPERDGPLHGRVVRIELTPEAHLLADVGATAQLRARALDANGHELDATFAWVASGADGAFTVDANGTITALQGLGGGTVTASAGGVTSPAAVVLVARPVPGARLVADDHVRAGPEPAGDAADRLVSFVLDGERPDVGAIVIASEAAPLAGRVASVSEATGGWRVEIEQVPLHLLFERVSFDISLTFGDVVPVLAPDASASFMQRSDDGWRVELAFDTPESDLEPSTDVEAAALKDWLQKCKVEGTPILMQPKPLKIDLDIKQPWHFEAAADHGPDGDLRRWMVYLEGEVRAKATGGLEVSGALGGKVTCEVHLGYIPLPISGALAALIYPSAPIALFFELDGSATLKALEFGLDGEAGARVGVGFEWNRPVGAASDGYTNLSQISDVGLDVAPRFRSPDDATLRFQGAASAGIKTGLNLGNRFSGYDLTDVFLVGRLQGDVMPVEQQIADAGYASNYAVKLVLAARPTDDVEDILRLVLSAEAAKRIKESIDVALTIEVPLATSPRLAEPPLVATSTPTGDGDGTAEYELRVVLDPATTTWPVPVLPYAVADIEVYRLRTDGATEIVAKVAANTLQTVFDLAWTGEEDGRFHAFVVPSWLPVVALELGQVRLTAPYRVRAFPASDEILGLPVPTTYFGSFDLINEGAPVLFEAGPPGSPEVTLTGPTSGAIPAGGTATIEYDITCTEEAAAVTTIPLVFTADDGTFILGEDVPTAFHLTFNCEPQTYSVGLSPAIAQGGGPAPTVLSAGFTLTNRGAPVAFEVSTLVDKVLLILPSEGWLDEGASADVSYLYHCEGPEQGTVLFSLGFSDGATPVVGDLPTHHGFEFGCVEPPPPCDEGEDCSLLPLPGEGDDDDGTGDGDVVDVGGATGRSWGDPHLVTLDGRPYDFHGVGDYVLSRATDPNDDFEVQVRYRALRPGEPWYSPSGISVGVGVAASVRGHAVTVLIDASGRFEAYLDGVPLDVAGNLALELPNRGTLRIEGSQATISWPDSTSVTLDGRTGRALGFDDLDDIRLYVPTRRFGKVEGLLGDADRDPVNDLRVPGGEPVLQPSTPWLYGAFRDAWRVPVGSPASLFAVGPDLFDPGFPAVVVTVADFGEAERAAARAVCEAAGVTSHLFLQSCMLDVLITGDAAAAEAAFLADPATPKLSLTPALAFVYGGSNRYFGAVVEGSSDRRVTWSASRGTLTPWNEAGTYVRYAPPAELDEAVVITASLVADGRVTATARVVLLEASCVPPEDFDKVWQGGVDASWSNRDNWLPAGVPTNTDRAFICAAAANQPALAANAAVGALATEPGARVRLGNATLSVHGDLTLAPGSVDVESGSLRLVGDGAILTGTLPAITINALTAAGGPLTVDGNLTLGLDRNAHLDPSGHTLTVLGNLATVSVGCLVSTRPEDRVVIHGSATLNGWDNQAHCVLTAGTLELRGDLTTTADQLFSRLTPDAGHRTLLAGTTPQTITIGGLALGHPQGNRFHDLEITNPAGVTFTQPVDVRGDVRFTDTAGSVTSTTTVHLEGSIDEPQGGARWQVATTNLRGPARDVLLPGALPGHLVVNSQIVLGHALTVEGNLTIATTGAARLDPGPHVLTIVGNLTTVSGSNVNGCLAMTHPETRVVVEGDARFNGYMAAGGCVMTDGVMELRGDFGTANVWNSMFTPSDDHLVRFTGTGPQDVAFGDTAESPSANRFQHVEIVNAAGVTFSQNARVVGQLDLVGRMTNQAVLTIPLGGALRLRSGSYLDNLAGSIALGGTCTVEPGADGVGLPPACQAP